MRKLNAKRMVNLVIVGSVGLDTVKTPFGEAREALGGAAVHASYAASFFADVGIVAVAGKDFPEKYLDILRRRNIDLSGLQMLDGRTLRWHAYYEYDMNQAHTLKTELNVLDGFSPAVPDAYRKCRHLFLANNDPEIQLQILEQMKGFAALDTMNLWIENKKEQLLEAINKVDVLLLNEGEARQLFRTTNLITAGMTALNHGPRACVIKKGEHGVLLFTDGRIFSLPGYPLENVRDPTGAGDSFAGGFCGYLAKTADMSEENLRKAIVFGSAIASFNVEDFSLNRLTNLSFSDIEKRYREFQDIIKFW